MLKRQLAFPFWKQKLRLELTFSVQNGIRKIPGEKGEAGSALATPSITAIEMAGFGNRSTDEPLLD